MIPAASSGTRNAEGPAFWPSRTVRAITMIAPPWLSMVTEALSPLIRYPSGVAVAVVAIAVTSEPHPGSVSPRHTYASPSVSGRSQASRT